MRAPLLRPIRAHDDEAVGLQVQLVLQHAVLRSACPGCRGRLQERSGEDRVFEDGGDDGGKIPQHHDVPHDRNGQESSPPKKSPPESAPKSAAGAPEFDAVAGVVEADDLLLGVIAFPRRECFMSNPAAVRLFTAFSASSWVGYTAIAVCLMFLSVVLEDDGRLVEARIRAARRFWRAFVPAKTRAC